MDLGPFERSLAKTTLAPYIVKAMAMIDRPRKAGSNMFRHQMSTMAILLDYKTIDPVLLKASVIHDLFEDVRGLPWVTRETIESIDADGPAVYALVEEVTIRHVGDARAEGGLPAAHDEDGQRPREEAEAGGPDQQSDHARVRERSDVCGAVHRPDARLVLPTRKR